MKIEIAFKTPDAVDNAIDKYCQEDKQEIREAKVVEI